MIDANARSDLYGFFSRLFVKELDDSAVELLRGPLGAELLPGLHSSFELGALSDAEARASRFDADFVHITVVNLVPYASFYLRDDARVEFGTGNPVASFLESQGFEVDLAAGRAVAPDHLGIVLEAMSRLCRHEADAVARLGSSSAQTIQTLQRTFLETYVLTWAPVYLFAVERCAHTHLYREVAHVLVDFVSSDHEALIEEAAA